LVSGANIPSANMPTKLAYPLKSPRSALTCRLTVSQFGQFSPVEVPKRKYGPYPGRFDSRPAMRSSIRRKSISGRDKILQEVRLRRRYERHLKLESKAQGREGPAVTLSKCTGRSLFAGWSAGSEARKEELRFGVITGGLVIIFVVLPEPFPESENSRWRGGVVSAWYCLIIFVR